MKTKKNKKKGIYDRDAEIRKYLGLKSNFNAALTRSIQICIKETTIRKSCSSIILIYFTSVFHFYALWKRKRILKTEGGTEMEHAWKMG